MTTRLWGSRFLLRKIYITWLIFLKVILRRSYNIQVIFHSSAHVLVMIHTSSTVRNFYSPFLDMFIKTEWIFLIVCGEQPVKHVSRSHRLCNKKELKFCHTTLKYHTVWHLPKKILCQKRIRIMQGVFTTWDGRSTIRMLAIFLRECILKRIDFHIIFPMMNSMTCFFS